MITKKVRVLQTKAEIPYQQATGNNLPSPTVYSSLHLNTFLFLALLVPQPIPPLSTTYTQFRQEIPTALQIHPRDIWETSKHAIHIWINGGPVRFCIFVVDEGVWCKGSHGYQKYMSGRSMRLNLDEILIDLHS